MGTARLPRPAYPRIDPDTLRRWLRRADVDAGRLPGATTDEQAELVRLRREVALLREERDILQKATAYFARASAPR